MRPSVYFFFALLLTLAGCDRRDQGSDTDSAPTVPQAADGSPSICTPEWFNWVNRQLSAQTDGRLNELYPQGLPEVGSGEWFEATDVLTAGSGDHGISPRPGSDEWCFMIQQRLNNPE